MLNADDSLDVFGVHGAGGILGALFTGIFDLPRSAAPASCPIGRSRARKSSAPPIIRSPAQLWIPGQGGLPITLVWSGVVAFLAYKLVDLTIGLRVSGEEEEREGLDISSHGESAYHS